MSPPDRGPHRGHRDDPGFGSDPPSGRTGARPEFGTAPRPANGPTAEQASDVTLDTGTTVVGIAAGDGVAMAADQRMSLGGRFTSNKNAKKLERVHPTAVLAISGAVGPLQDLVRSLRAEASLYESRRGERMSMTALSQIAGHLARGLRVTPLLGGVDADGGHLFELDGSGSVMADAYAAAGSGMQVAYGVLERRADEAASLAEASTVAVDAVAAASERDTASGNGVHLATVTGDGVDVETTASEETTGDASADAGEGA